MKEILTDEDMQVMENRTKVIWIEACKAGIIPPNLSITDNVFQVMKALTISSYMQGMVDAFENDPNDLIAQSIPFAQKSIEAQKARAILHTAWAEFYNAKDNSPGHGNNGS